jgi:membrane fusion protein, multidrug efflux system
VILLCVVSWSEAARMIELSSNLKLPTPMPYLYVLLKSVTLIVALVASAWAQKPTAVPTAPAALPTALPASTPKPPIAAPETPGVRVLLTPDLETVLVSQMVGRITALNAFLGSRVSRGQTVVAMDCVENQAKLKMSEAELASARETYDSKLRLKSLDAAGEVEVSLAASAVNRANGQIELTKAQIQSCTVLAPFSGRIAKLHVKPFQGVSQGQPLFELVSEGAPRLRLNVPSRWLRALKVGTTFTVDIDETGKSYTAKISALNAKVDAVAQTVEIEARFTSAFAELLPGMSGMARFSGMP